MAKYDIEDLLGDVQSFLAANLNTQITAINTEKNDGIVLGQVASTAYHLQYPNDRTEGNDPFIILDEAEEPSIQASGGGGALIATIHHVGITLVLIDNGMDLNIIRRLFRYRRAIKDVVIANWATIAGSNKFGIKAWSPSPPFNFMNTGYQGRVVGLVLSVAITD